MQQVGRAVLPQAPSRGRRLGPVPRCHRRRRGRRGARWAADNGTPFPVLADPDKTIIRAYGAESSAYVALVAPGGKVERLWAGYSAGMFREVTDAKARLSGRHVEPIEADEAPDDLYSGCPFD